VTAALAAQASDLQLSVVSMARKYSIRKTRRLRPLLLKHYKPPEPPDPRDTMLDQVVMTVLWVDAPPAKAREAYAKLAEAFVDWNELRVSMTTEAASVLTKCGLPASKAAALKRILIKAIDHLYCFDFEVLATRPREALKAWFTSIEGLPHHVAAAVLYHVFHYDRILVDADIARVIRRLGLAQETHTDADVEAGLEPVIPAKEAYAVYSALRQHALRVCTPEDFDCRKCPLRRECATAPGRIAELEAAEREARKKARARARKRRRAEAKARKAAAKAKRPAASKTRKAAPKAKRPAASKTRKAAPRRKPASKTRKAAPKRKPASKARKAAPKRKRPAAKARETAPKRTRKTTKR